MGVSGDDFFRGMEVARSGCRFGAVPLVSFILAGIEIGDMGFSGRESSCAGAELTAFSSAR